MSTLVITPPRSITHDCSGAMDCMTQAPGHAVGFMQQRIAAASPSQWRDFVVAEISNEGWARLVSVDHADSASVWNHAPLGEHLELGTPVALHALYNVLAVGSERYNVAVAR